MEAHSAEVQSARDLAQTTHSEGLSAKILKLARALTQTIHSEEARSAGVQLSLDLYRTTRSEELRSAKTLGLAQDLIQTTRFEEAYVANFLDSKKTAAPVVPFLCLEHLSSPYFSLRDLNLQQLFSCD